MDAEIVIIGAGIVGLAIAAEIACKHRSVYILERNPKFGQETSSRNSEVIHAGIYYPPDSLKAMLCKKGNTRLYDLCIRKGIPHRRCGKLIVSTNHQEDAHLEEILVNSKANEVHDVKRISKRQINKWEPEVRASSALFSPSTGIIDSHSLMTYLESRARNERAHLVYKTSVERIEKLASHHYLVQTLNPDREIFEFSTKIVINCAGLEADRMASSLGIDIDVHQYRQHFWKGEYFSVSGKPNRISSLVYPVPLPKNVGLGVHATIDLNGQLKLGPNAKYIPNRSYEYGVDPAEKGIFFQSATRFLPFIQLDDLHPAMAGIRPKLQKPGDPFRDFIIQEETDKGYPGFINLLGIESPGLTSCLAIARYVRQLLN
jgi:L-2-hydroxyglutarate oxidase LhgO